MKGSNYKDKWSQQANDMRWMSNHEKRKNKSEKKRIGVKHNTWSLYTILLYVYIMIRSTNQYL